MLLNLKHKARAGRIKLYYLDQCGFAPTLPTAYTWALPRQRKRVKSEAPQGRRVNAMAAYRPYGGRPRLDVFTAERTWDSYDFLAFVRSLPWSKVPRVVVLDNASLHTSGVVRRARAGLAAAGIYLYFLPPYSPELNEIEPVFRQVKYQEIPVRSHATRAGLARPSKAGSTPTAEACGRKVKRNPGGQLRRPRGPSRPPVRLLPRGGHPVGDAGPEGHPGAPRFSGLAALLRRRIVGRPRYVVRATRES